MVGHLADTGKEIAQTLLMFSKADAFHLLQLHLEDGLEMQDCLVNTEEETVQALLKTPKTELFESVELYST